MLHNLSIQLRLFLLAGLGVAGMVILVAASLITLNQKMTTLAQDKVNTLVEAGTSIVEKFVDSAESGAMDTELAQTTALAALASARFDGNDYFFVLDRDVTLVMHGAKPELNGQNFTGFTDQNGTLLFKDLVAQASSGGGYVNYVWPRAGSTDPVAKISYASPLNDWGWTIVTGVYVDDISAAFWEAATIQIILVVLTLVVLSLIALAISRSISNPVKQLTGTMSSLKAGDYDVDVPSQDFRDDIGEMARSVEAFKQGLKQSQVLAAQMAAEEAEKAERAERISEATAAFNRDIGTLLENTDNNLRAVIASIENVASMASTAQDQSSTVAAAADQATHNVQAVASSAEELSASISEISRQVTTQSERSHQAGTGAEHAKGTVESLSAQAQRIGSIVDLIDNIAAQTNLLALNATIEAARAGDAGKGFAVVASEVKALATQTQKATSEITEAIQGIQVGTTETVASITQLTADIDHVVQLSSDVGAAIEQQTAATAEISRNVEEAAVGNQEVASNIAQVSTATLSTEQTSETLLKNIDDMAQSMKGLERTVSGFLRQVA